MDNFKTPKGKKLGRRVSIDGIVTSGPKKEKPTSGVIGDFKQSEGFHPYAQSKIEVNKKSKTTLGQADVDDDVVAMGDIENQSPRLNPKKEKAHKRFFGRKKNSKDRGDKKKRRWLNKKVVLVVLVIVLIGAGTSVFLAYKKLHGVLKGGASGAAALNSNVDPNLLKGEGDGRVNILLMGKGGPGHDGPDLTDTIMIASLDPIQKEVGLVSIPRDLWVSSAYGSTKVNAVYANAKYASLNHATGKNKKQNAENAEKAGFEAIKSMIQKITGMPIHYQMMVDFTSFRQAVDAVGGVTIDVKQTLYDYIIAPDNGGSPLIATKGVQHMNGKKALLYAQSRHSSARGDFDRTERQREVLVALKEKVLTLGTFANPVTMARLVNAFGSHVRTDFTQDEITRIYNIGKQVDSKKIKSIGLADPPNNFVTTSMIGDQSVVVPVAGLDNYGPIQNYLRTTLKDGFLRKENARIMVLNGTGSVGLASKDADILRSYGYRIVKVGDAPTKNYASTIIVDLTGGVDKYTKHYLEKRYKGTAAVTSLPDSKIGISKDMADFVIIVGQNESITN